MDNFEQVAISDETKKQKEKKKNLLKYVFYIVFVLVATGLALFFSLKDNFNAIITAFKNCDYKFLGIMIAIVAATFFLDGLVITIFMRLYSKKYHLHQGVAVSLVGFFYSGITPGASGGQVMQAYTLKKQGSQISSAASLLVMYFILYQVALIIFDVFIIIFKWDILMNIGMIDINGFKITIIPLTIMGFLLNLFLIFLLFVMSYSHKMHNFIMHYGIGFLAKIKILKHPDKTRENLRIQVENFKIELRRLQSNIPVTILIVSLFLIMIILKFSIPWFAGLALSGYGYYTNSAGEIVHTIGTTDFKSFFDACFLSGYHQMVSGLLPLPGGSGVSELFFNILFNNFYNSGAVINAAQIMWRATTFHVVLLISGLFSAFYKARPNKEEYLTANRKTFVTMQFQTFDDRKKSSDTLYETSRIAKKEFQNKLKNNLNVKSKKKEYDLSDNELIEDSPFVINEQYVDKIKKKKKNKDLNDNEEEYRDFGIK